MLRAEGEAQAITTVFEAIHAGQPDQALLAYQYMQMLPEIAQGDANKVWVVPSEITKALEGLGSAVGALQSGDRPAGRTPGVSDQPGIPQRSAGDFRAPAKIDVQAEIEAQNAKDAEAAARTVQEAIDEARNLERTKRDRPPSLQPSAPADEPLGIGTGDEQGATGSDPETEDAPGPELAPPGQADLR